MIVSVCVPLFMSVCVCVCVCVCVSDLISYKSPSHGLIVFYRGSTCAQKEFQGAPPGCARCQGTKKIIKGASEAKAITV